MIYLDTSVALAQLLAEDRRPPEALWDDTPWRRAACWSTYELWTPLHASGLSESHGEAVREFAGADRDAGARPGGAREGTGGAFPGPGPLRTLDALHLASCVYLADHG